MGLSQTLLVVAVATAIVPILLVGLKPPSTLRHLEKAFVSGVGTFVIGAFVASRVHDFDFYALAHLLYLGAVVTVPGVLGGWFLLSLLRRSRSLLVTIGAVVAVLAAMVGVWATHIEPNWLRVDRVSLAASVAQPIKIGVLSDLQTPNVGDYEWNAVNTLIAEEPNLVLIPGDLYQAHWSVIQERTPDFVALLQALVDNVEVVAIVSGDSDGADRISAMADASGAIFLDNAQQTVTVAGQSVRITGAAVESSPERLTALAELGTATDALSLVLSHRPDVVFDLPLRSDVDLIVSGHTHGGQVSLPFLGPPVTFSDIPRDLAAGGIGIVDQFAVYVSTGVGIERLGAPQVRFGVRPSIGIITVVPTQ